MARGYAYSGMSSVAAGAKWWVQPAAGVEAIITGIGNSTNYVDFEFGTSATYAGMSASYIGTNNGDMPQDYGLGINNTYYFGAWNTDTLVHNIVYTGVQST